MEKSPYIFTNEEVPLSTVSSHHDIDCITRFFSEKFPVYTAIHKINAADCPEQYTDEHSHTVDEINIIIGDEDLKYEVTIGEERSIVGNNTSIFIPAGKKHSANVISGSGYYIAIRLDKEQEIKEKTATKSKKIVYAFPGQGSQSLGMGKELFGLYPEYIDAAEDILGYSIKKICLEDPLNRLNNTLFTQPVLYVINALSYYKEIEETKKSPDFLMGHSLGEYNSLQAAGAFDFETGVRLVKKRGELMASAKDGAMAAVLNCEKEVIEDILLSNGVSNQVSIANYNTPKQIVISGGKSDIYSLEEAFHRAGAGYSVLKVSGAFHSSHMLQARKEFEAYMEEFHFHKLNIPVISNFTAREYADDEIKELLCEQLTGAVQWTESVSYLMNGWDVQFKQIGPGKVVQRLIDSIQKMNK